MASLATVPHATTAASVSILVRVGEKVAQAWKAWRNRREFYRLGEKTDTELADIGLTRADLSVVVDLPFATDLTAHLGAIAHARLRLVTDRARSAP